MKKGEIIVENVSLSFPIYKSLVLDRFLFFLKKMIPGYKPNKKKVLKNISFKIKSGQNVGFVGLNGAGKTTLLKIISGLINPDEGRVMTSGKVMTLLSLGIGFKPNLTGRENIKYGAIMLKADMKNFELLEEKIILFSELGPSIDQPFFTYSSGMKARLGFSLATHIKADIVILDETLASGDRSFINKCYIKINELMNSKTTVLFVSHNVGEVSRLTEESMLIDQGELLSFGKSQDIIKKYDQIIFERYNKSKESKELESYIDELDIELKIKNQKGEPTEIIDIGEDISLELIIDTKRDLEDFYFELILKDNVNTGFISYIQSHRWDMIKKINEHKNEIKLFEGKNMINLQIKNFNLGEGNYYFDLNYSTSGESDNLLSVPFIKGFYVTYNNPDFKGSNCIIEFATNNFKIEYDIKNKNLESD